MRQAAPGSSDLGAVARLGSIIKRMDEPAETYPVTSSQTVNDPGHDMGLPNLVPSSAGQEGLTPAGAPPLGAGQEPLTAVPVVLVDLMPVAATQEALTAAVEAPGLMLPATGADILTLGLGGCGLVLAGLWCQLKARWA